MSLHTAIEYHVVELQSLLTEKDEQRLLDKAREQWGEEDARYEVLAQFVELQHVQQKFADSSKPAESEKKAGGNSSNLQNKPGK